MNDVTRRQLETRRDAFADAAREFPCVRHCWKCWPENEPQPPIPEKYHPKNAIPIEQRTDGTLVWDVLPCQVGDGPGERIIEGMASLWWELRMYGEYPRRRDVTEPAR